MPAEICMHPWRFAAEAFRIAGNLYYVRNTDWIFRWTIPIWLLHAGLVIYQGLFNRNIVDLRAGGLADNQNAGAGFLVLGIIYLSALLTQY